MTDAIRIMNSLTAQEIKDQAFRALVEQGEAQVYQLIDPVLNAVGVRRLELPRNSLAHKSKERFINRLRVALSKLVTEAAIIKIGIGGQLPNGTIADRTNVTYFSKEGYQKALARHQQENASREAERQRWQAIGDRLGKAGFARAHSTVITADAWEALLNMAGL